MSDSYTLFDGATDIVTYEILAGEVSVTDTRHPYGDPRRHGAVCDGVGDDTVAVQNAFASWTALILPPKTIKVSGATVLTMTAGKTIIANGATLVHSTTTGTTINVPDGVNDWEILGHLTIVGAGNATGTAKQLHITGSNRYQVENLVCKDASGWGLYVEPGTYVAPGGQGQFASVLCNNCWVGAEGVAGTGAEYATFALFSAMSCTSPLIVAAGNWAIAGGNVLRNTNGVLVNSGANNAHGVFSGMQISHNTNYNLKCVGVTNGQTLVGCNIYADDATHGYIWLVSSQNINIVGGLLDAPIKNETPAGHSKIQGACTPGTFAIVVSDADPKLLLIDNFTPAGGFFDAPNYWGVPVAPALGNSWVNYGAGTRAAGYWKDRDSVVHLEGLIKSGTVTTGTVLFSLPVGFRPASNEIFFVDSNAAVVELTVQGNGDVVLGVGASATYLSLSGVTFRAG